jgi:hypothetical protein
MAGRRIDFFGTFLDSMKREPAPSTDPANAVLKALRSDGRPAQDPIPFVGNSVSRFISVSEQLAGLGAKYGRWRLCADR